jgi:hypothetical protein
MASGLKYLMLDDCTPVIFPAYIEHGQMAAALQTILATKKVTGAGFVGSLHINAAYGSSFGLDIKSQPRDTEVINKLGDY